MKIYDSNSDICDATFLEDMYVLQHLDVINVGKLYRSQNDSIKFTSAVTFMGFDLPRPSIDSRRVLLRSPLGLRRPSPYFEPSIRYEALSYFRINPTSYCRHIGDPCA